MNRNSDCKNTPRIPLALQSIFLNGGRGVVINIPPPGHVAMKKFRKWRWHTDDAKSTRSIVTDIISDDPNSCAPTDKIAKKKRVRGLIGEILSNTFTIVYHLKLHFLLSRS